MTKKVFLSITLVLLMSAPLAAADHQRGAGFENISFWLESLLRAGSSMDPNGVGPGIDPNGLDSRGTMDPDGANATPNGG